MPTQGVYCASGLTKDGILKNRFAETLDSLLSIVENLKGSGQDVFVAPGSYDGFSRKADNSVYFKSFFVDLDIGPKGYASKQDALDAIAKFVDDTELPPPVRIDSGRGIHAYWIFDADVPTDEWKPYAEKFKALCISKELRIDPVVTADAARIMRCPDTFNHKTEPPSPSKLIDSEINEYSFDSFKEYLLSVGQVLDVKGEIGEYTKNVLTVIQKGLDEDSAAIRDQKRDNYEYLFSIVAERSLNGDGCAQIDYALRNAATLGYNEWIAALQTAWKCDDGEEAIHLLSEDHPGYDREKVIRKAATFDAPRTCDKYAEESPDRCKGCQYRGKINTPKVLGRKLKYVPEVDVRTPDSADSIRQTPNTQKIPVFPQFLEPFSRGINGGIYYEPPPKVSRDGKKTHFPAFEIIPSDVFPIKRMYSPLDGDCLMMKNILPHETSREFLLPMSTAYTPDMLTKVMTSNGVYFQTDSTKHVKDYIVRWGQYMQKTEAAELMRMQFGWTEDFNGFVVGNSEIKRDGSITQAASSSFIHSLAKVLKPKGDYEVWKTAVNKLNLPSLELHAFGFLCGFGSPLMRYTSTNGATVSFTGKSGSAKTGALFAALSIAGAPKETSVFEATNNALINRTLGMHSLVFGLDEVTNRSTKELSQFVHQVSSGRAKIRLQSSVNAERSLELTSAMLAILTTNEPIYDKLLIDKASPDGEVARLIEFHILKPKILVERPELGAEIFETLNYHHGHAIYDYIKKVFELGDSEILVRLEKWRQRFKQDYGDDVANRFFDNLVAVDFAGGEIAIEAGIINLDLERIYHKVMEAFISVRDNTMKINEIDYKALLGDFLNKNHAGVLVLDGSKVTTEPRLALIARVEIDDQLCYVSKTVFKQYLAELKVSSSEYEHGMKALNMLPFVGKKRLSTGWKAGMSTPPINVYGFKIDSDLFPTDNAV